MWGKSLLRLAVGLKKILNFIATAGVRRTVCGVKLVTPAGQISGSKKRLMWGKMLC
jgi:hypothetical protein